MTRGTGLGGLSREVWLVQVGIFLNALGCALAVGQPFDRMSLATQARSDGRSQVGGILD